VANLSKKFENYERTIAALNDTISVSIENGIKTYSKQAPEININDLVNSEYFKTLNESQQKYYVELSNVKKLLAATTAELISMKNYNDTINIPSNISNDSIAFKRNQVIAFNQKDTTENLQYNIKLTLNKPIKFDMSYKYKLNISTTFERQKDKSVLVKYKLDDPNAVITNMNSFIIPPDEPTTKLGKWYKKNKKTINIISGSVIFSAGVYTGVKLSK
jgi:hypothetical protein